MDVGSFLSTGLVSISFTCICDFIDVISDLTGPVFLRMQSSLSSSTLVNNSCGPNT